MRTAISLLTFLLLLTACEQRPEGVLSKGKMKAVLYDYHLAQAMAEEARGAAKDSARMYIEAVFEKHEITEAELDSSLSWYNYHSEELRDIYAAVHKRFEQEHERLSLATAGGAINAFISAGGDTTDLWADRHTIILRAGELLNVEAFSLPVDSSFHSDDKFVLSANITFLSSADKRSRDARLTAAITLHDSLGKTFSKTRQLTQPTDISLEISSAVGNPLTLISGYFYLDAAVSERNMCVIDDIHLVRMHKPSAVEPEVIEETTAEADSVSADTASADTSKDERLSPTELRKSTTDGKAPTRIKTAPDKRTPNSIGPTRKKKNTPTRQKAQ